MARLHRLSEMLDFTNKVMEVEFAKNGGIVPTAVLFRDTKALMLGLNFEDDAAKEISLQALRETCIADAVDAFVLYGEAWGDEQQEIVQLVGAQRTPRGLRHAVAWRTIVRRDHTVHIGPTEIYIGKQNAGELDILPERAPTDAERKAARARLQAMVDRPGGMFAFRVH